MSWGRGSRSARNRRGGLRHYRGGSGGKFRGEVRGDSRGRTNDHRSGCGIAGDCSGNDFNRALFTVLAFLLAHQTGNFTREFSGPDGSEAVAISPCGLGGSGGGGSTCQCKCNSANKGKPVQFHNIGKLPPVASIAH